jgi:hypothetical protein
LFYADDLGRWPIEAPYIFKKSHRVARGLASGALAVQPLAPDCRVVFVLHVGRASAATEQRAWGAQRGKLPRKGDGATPPAGG